VNPDDPPSRVRALPSWQLNRAALRATRLVGQRAAELGVSRSTYSSLAALDEYGRSSQVELGRRVGLDRKDVSSLVNDLESSGLVLRGPDPSDGRRNVLEITPTGRQLLEVLDRVFADAQDELLNGLSARDRAELTRLLAKLIISDAGS
jgi:DNA-binding MarR family transcriptional regulator